MDNHLKKEFNLFRDRKFGVGKNIGGGYYIHKNYANTDIVPDLEIAKTKLPDSFNYDIIRYKKKTNEVAFIQCPDFDTSHEPEVHDCLSVVVKDGEPLEPSVTKKKNNVQIYHHKWLFVPDDYPNFSISESKQRSIDWKEAERAGGVKISLKIGYSNFWDQWTKENNLEHRKGASFNLEGQSEKQDNGFMSSLKSSIEEVVADKDEPDLKPNARNAVKMAF